MSNNKYINRFIKRLVLVLILFAFFFSFNTNVKAAIVNIGDTENYGYTGDVQTFTAPYTGVYKLKTWGAQGGSTHGFAGGGGGYSEGKVHLNAGDILYIYVGGQGSAASAPGESLTGGYNGGGSVTGDPTVNHYTTSGGGATHIATVSGLLSTLENQKDKILIVSGGGGGATWQENYDEFSAGARQGPGGSGGGSLGIFYLQTGVNSWIESTWADTTLIAGTQTAGYAFGQGASNTGGSAGGGGFYGGKTYQRAGAGGSGYVGNPLLTDKHMTMYATKADYNNTKFNPNTSITTASSETPTDDTPKAGWGYAKVTFLGNNDTTLKTLTVSGYEIMPALRSDKRDYIVFVNEDETSLILTAETNDSKASVTYNSTITIEGDTTTETLTVTAEDGSVGIYTLNIYKKIPSDMGGEYAYTGDVQTFTATKGGLYKLETWGAQGGNANSTYIGGYGGYSTGVVKLKKGETVYIYVGQGGTTCHRDILPVSSESYNGGGMCNAIDAEGYHYTGSGGGATHIATVSGPLSSLEDNRNSILIVSGGGGGAYYHTANIYGNGGSAGGFIGNDGTSGDPTRTPGKGGTQTFGGTGADGLYDAHFGRFGHGGDKSSGGGSGYYGGGSTLGGTGAYTISGAGGGSGYIGSTRLTTTDQVTKHMSCYNCATSDDESTKTISNTCHSSAATADCAKEGDGYARIMFIEEYTSDATLSFLSVTNYELDKKFNSNKYEYSLPTFEETVETIEINATPNDYNATVSGDGIINVPYGKSTHEIIVTAQDGTIGIYKIKLNREATPEDEYSYNYTGDVQEFIAPVTGKYKLETWGAQGGYAYTDNVSGGYGGYSTGTISLKANDHLYIVVGGQGESNCQTTNCQGGYNGGSDSTKWNSIPGTGLWTGGGGGATHIATQTGVLSSLSSNQSSVLIVSGGGGGGDYYTWTDRDPSYQDGTSYGGSGGGYKGVVGAPSGDKSNTNEAGGQTGTYFGRGYTSQTEDSTGGSGGGWYGGISSEVHATGSGGSGYIGNTKLIDKHMTCYNCETSTEESTKTSSTACFSISPKEDCAKRGNGYAKITPLGIESEDATLKSLTVTNQELKQAFDPERLNYDLILDEDATSVEITAEANDSKATLTYNQNVELTSNPQLEEIIVTAEDGTINVYSINIKRAKKAYLKASTDFRNNFNYLTKNLDYNLKMKQATSEEYNAVKDSLAYNNIISLNNSPYPVYMWVTGDKLLYYSEADVIYMNPNCSEMFYVNSILEEIDLSGFDTSKVTNMEEMFSNATAKKINISNFDTRNVTNMRSMFYNTSAEEIDVSHFDTSNVTNMEYMFSAVEVETLDLSNFDIHNVTSLRGMFSSAKIKTLDLSNLDTSHIENMSYMFRSAKIDNLNLDIDTQNVTDMSFMFRQSNFETLDLTGFDVSNVTNMEDMFSLMSSLRELNISGWKFENEVSLNRLFASDLLLETLIMDNIDTSKVTNMASMFYECKSLKELDLSNLDTSNVTTMFGMFYDCDSLEELDLSNFDTRKVTNMTIMFSKSSNLKSINLSSFKVYNVTEMKMMFSECMKLESLDLSSFDVSKVTDMSYMFNDCRQLKTLDLSNFYSPNLENVERTFYSCSNLETIYSNELFTVENARDTIVFSSNNKLVGGQGTRYDYGNEGKDYARVDDPENGKPGYFTYKEYKPKIYYPDDTFEEVQINYEFTFPETWSKDNENVSVVTFKYQNGEEDTVANVTKTYEFNKWKVNDTEYEPNNTLNIMVDTYLEAIYNETLQNAVFPETPTSEHATFLGWYTEPTSGEKVTFYKGEEDITLYARWNYDNMTISFEENGGEEISDITVSYGSEIGELPTTTKPGFMLEGWYSDEDLTNKVLSSTVVNDNITLYAKWIEDDFPTVYQDDEEVFDGTNYLNTHIKLYNEENISKDYEIGFTIEEFDESIQNEYATFVQDKYELESAGYPGLVVRMNNNDSVLKTNIAHRRTEDDRNYIYIDNYPATKKVRIVRKDNTIYYSVNDGELSVLHNFNNFTNYFETEATFGAALDENNSPYRFLKGKLSNMYIRLGEAHDDHMVTYPDGNVEIYPHNTIITLGTNNTPKANDPDITVTFKNHNDTDDIVKSSEISYTPNGFDIGDDHYDNESTLLVDSDKLIENSYTSHIDIEFPDEPKKDGYEFTGWYTEEEGGEKIESPDEIKTSITLHAHYRELVTATLLSGQWVRNKINNLTHFKTINNFRKATLEEYNLIKDTLTSSNVISTDDSQSVVYMWYTDGEDILYYSEADIIYMNPDCYNMFNSEYIKNIDLSGLDSSHVTNMGSMFDGAKNLETIIFGDQFDTSNVTDMSFMFRNCESLGSIDLSKFDTSNVTNMMGMFEGCSSLTSLDVKSFDTSNVISMGELFSGCNSLESVNVFKFDTSKVSNLSGMFYNCSSLKSIDLHNFDISNVTAMRQMFSNCSSLTELDLSSFKLKETNDSLINLTQMFSGCTNLETIYVSDLWEPFYIIGDSVFANDIKLVGGAGTAFDSSKTAYQYARVDDPASGEPGYFTSKDYKPRVYYPDGQYEEIEIGDTFTFPETYSKADEDTFRITLNHNDGVTENETLYVKKQFVFNNWRINKIIYNGGDTITIYKNTFLDADYIGVTVPTILPTQVFRENYVFDGWYTEYSGGEKVESYGGMSDTTLYAHWLDAETIPVTTPDGIDYVPVGTEYTLGTNDIPKEDDTYDVTFKYHDDVTDDLVKQVTTKYTPNGWLVNGDHYDDEASFEVTEETLIELDYIETIIPVEFPSEPVREHYEFDGWYTEETGGEKVESYSEKAEITLHAHWIGETQTITTPDGEEEEVPYGTEYTLGTNNTPKDDTTNDVTFKYHDDVTDDLVRQVTKTYTENGWLVNGVHYDDEESFEVIENVTIEPDYIETVIPVEFPEKPKKENLAFTGWFDEETGGNKYTSYSEEEDIVLHAQYTDDIITINIPGEEPEIIPKGEDYILPSNSVEKDSEEVATVTFKLHNGEDDIVGHVTKSYTPNGWLINGVHYNDGDTITPTEDVELIPDYTNSLVGVEFPSDPTKEGLVFIGWYDSETDGTKYTSYSREEDFELHAQYGLNEAYLVRGESFFFLIPNNVNGEFRKATENEYNLVKDTLTDTNLVSDETSNVPVYMWKSGNNMLYYSTADTIYMNKDSYKMFYYSYFTSIDISGLNSSKVENMSRMFLDCDNLTTLDLSTFDTSNVTDMSRMIAQMDNLTSVNVSSFDTSKVTDMEGMFAFDRKLESIDVSNFNTSKVERIDSIFTGCSKIKTLDIYNWDISNVTEFSSSFRNMSSLESITMSNYYNRKASDMSYMFAGDSKLQTLDLSNINANHVAYITELFNGDSNLTTVYATKDAWPISSTGSGNNAFSNATSIVGGQGTTYDSTHINKEYAIVDDPDNGNPGYFTDVSTIREQHDVLFHYSDGDAVEKHNHNTIMTLEYNNTSKPVEVLGTITFKYHDDETDDSTLDIIKSYSNNGWLVNGVHYDDEGKVVIDEDKEVNYDYLSTSTGAELPIPTRDGFDFDGWYTEETGGEKVESYEGTEDIVLHAHWSSTLPTDITVDINDLTMVPNDIHQIVVTFIPEGSSDVITYTGYDDSIISVSEDGIITALSKGETTITVGTENTDIEKTISITVLSDKLESTNYTVEDKVRPKENEEDPDITDRIVIGAEPGTLISEFKDNMTNPNEYIKIYDSEGNELSDDDIVKTGLTIKLVINGIVHDEAIIIVRGDINEDGLVNVIDKSLLSEHILRLNNIEGYRTYAADVDNNDIINVIDKSKLSEYILRLIDSLNE